MTMFRQRRTFRPVLSAALEERTVPSPFGFGGFFPFGGFFGRGVASVPAQDARQVAQEFRTFQQTYSQDVRSILLPSGTTNPAANRTAFNAAVATALGTLNSSIDSTIANLPTCVEPGHDDPGRAPRQRHQHPPDPARRDPHAQQHRLPRVPGLQPGNAQFINQISGTVTNQVRTASAPTGSISETTIQQDLSLVQTDFQSFSQTYFNDVQTILLPTGTTPLEQ